MKPAPDAPRLLVTGFGPFPGAPDNPTEALVRGLAAESPETFGAGALRAIVLPTEYRKSWTVLRRVYANFAPDVAMHLGLSRKTKVIALERHGRRRIRTDRPDAAGFAPVSGYACRIGPDRLTSSLPVETIAKALQEAGFPAEISDDAGGYVCGATLYRSLHTAAGTSRLVGFAHVPPEDAGGYSRGRLKLAAELILRTAVAIWRGRGGEPQVKVSLAMFEAGPDRKGTQSI